MYKDDKPFLQRKKVMSSPEKAVKNSEDARTPEVQKSRTNFIDIN